MTRGEVKRLPIPGLGRDLRVRHLTVSLKEQVPHSDMEGRLRTPGPLGQGLCFKESDVGRLKLAERLLAPLCAG